MAAILIAASGCVISKKQVVTGSAETGFITNIVTTVNQANLAFDCAVFEITATPLLTQALINDPEARPIVIDVRTAIDGIQNGVNTDTMKVIVGFAGKNAALDKQMSALVQKVSDLRGQLMTKFGTSNAGIIEAAVAASVIRVCDASLLATQ